MYHHRSTNHAKLRLFLLKLLQLFPLLLTIGTVAHKYNYIHLEYNEARKEHLTSHHGKLETTFSFFKEDVNAGSFWHRCPWIKPHPVDWIHQTPAFLVLILNLGFLAAIMWVLITKLRSANTVETQQYHKASKALLVLMPLLGVTYVLTVTFPVADETTINIFIYVRAVLLSTQVSELAVKWGNVWWIKLYMSLGVEYACVRNLDKIHLVTFDRKLQWCNWPPHVTLKLKN